MGFIWIGAVPAIAVGETSARIVFVRVVKAKKTVKKTRTNNVGSLADTFSLCTT